MHNFAILRIVFIYHISDSIVYEDYLCYEGVVVSKCSKDVYLFTVLDYWIVLRD